MQTIYMYVLMFYSAQLLGIVYTIHPKDSLFPPLPPPPPPSLNKANKRIVHVCNGYSMRPSVLYRHEHEGEFPIGNSPFHIMYRYIAKNTRISHIHVHIIMCCQENSWCCISRRPLTYHVIKVIYNTGDCMTFIPDNGYIIILTTPTHSTTSDL